MVLQDLIIIFHFTPRQYFPSYTRIFWPVVTFKNPLGVFYEKIRNDPLFSRAFSRLTSNLSFKLFIIKFFFFCLSLRRTFFVFIIHLYRSISNANPLGPVVRKPTSAKPGLKVNRGFYLLHENVFKSKF